jgi:ectoine hydroxylase-related dioxygenase (phytanoyl-CoA dioxygenase family)
MLEHLREHGYVVVREALAPEERQRAEAFLWAFMREVAGWRQGRPSTWTDESIMHMGLPTKGLVNGRGAGQSDLSWLVRTRPRVRKAFEKIWGTEELITSFDGLNIFRPWHHGFQKTIGGWFHVDQGRETRGFQCVQGLVSLFDQGPDTGGLVVLPGSHKHHDALCELARDTTEYIELPQDSKLLQAEPQGGLLVACRAGDLVLWDSRTVHCNAPASVPPMCPPGRLLRAAVYVCMTPRSWATEQDLERRRQSYELRVTTSHWPHKQVMGFGWGRAPRLDYATADPERRRLI